MIQRYLEAAVSWLKRVITEPRGELDRWQRAARFAYDLGRFGARQLQHDRAPQMAAALAFRALFGLFPLLVVVTILVRALIGIDEFLALITQLLAWASLDTVKVVGAGGAESQTLAQWLGKLIGEAATINLTAIGWVGLMVVIYAAIGLMTTIENAFNIIYRSPDGRSWALRVPLYWFLLTVSPIAIGLAAWLNRGFEGWLTLLAAHHWMLILARLAWNLLFGWTLMLAVYMLVPNAKVRFQPAAAGALVAVILLEMGKHLLGATLSNAFSISRLSGSLGLIPLFMFWTYLMWLAVLFGLQVSAALQMLHGRRLQEIERQRELTGLIEPASLITVIELIARRFETGESTSAESIAEQLAMPRSVVREMLEHLVQAGLLHAVDRDQDRFCLAQPPEKISAAQLIDIGFHMIDQCGGRRSPLLDRLRDAQRELARQETLAGVMAQ